MSDNRNMVCCEPFKCKSVSIGPLADIYIPAERNICIGHYAGSKTKTDNNIIIGNDIDAYGNEIKIGNDEQKTVTIGAYDLKKMMDIIKKQTELILFLEQRVCRLEKHSQ